MVFCSAKRNTILVSMLHVGCGCQAEPGRADYAGVASASECVIRT